LTLFSLVANILRVFEGGWVPLALGAFICLLIWIWVRGKRLIDLKENDGAMTLTELGRSLSKSAITRVAGTAVYMTANPEGVPGTILHNMKHYRVLHERNIVLTVRTASVPYVPQDERATYEKIDANFTRVTLRYGFMDTPNVPADLAFAIPKNDNAVTCNNDELFCWSQHVASVQRRRLALLAGHHFDIPATQRL